MAKQMGDSRQGPDDLDRAVMNQGNSAAEEASPTEEEEDELYATSGDLDDQDTQPLLADGEMVGSWSGDETEEDQTLLAGDESVGPWSQEEDDELALDATADDLDDDTPRGWPEEPGPRSGRR
jgi:hypothetical protein